MCQIKSADILGSTSQVLCSLSTTTSKPPSVTVLHRSLCHFDSPYFTHLNLGNTFAFTNTYGLIREVPYKHIDLFTVVSIDSSKKYKFTPKRRRGSRSDLYLPAFWYLELNTTTDKRLRARKELYRFTTEEVKAGVRLVGFSWSDGIWLDPFVSYLNYPRQFPPQAPQPPQ